MTRLKTGLAAVVALVQTAVLFYMIESRASILRNGRAVVLATAPVDPNDIMRGDYVILSYAISRIEHKVIKGTPPPSDGSKPVHVALVPGEGGRFVFSRASWQPIADLKPEEIVIAGQTPDGFYIGTENVPLTYGIERFYVPEGEGRPIEERVGERRVDVVLAVNAEGKAQVRGLRMDGKSVYEEPLY
jgi:uncharacterized membrane-anchored protein